MCCYVCFVVVVVAWSGVFQTPGPHPKHRVGRCGRCLRVHQRLHAHRAHFHHMPGAETPGTTTRLRAGHQWFAQGGAAGVPGALLLRSPRLACCVCQPRFTVRLPHPWFVPVCPIRIVLLFLLCLLLFLLLCCVVLCCVVLCCVVLCCPGMLRGWWFAVACGGLRWLAVACGGLRWFGACVPCALR